MPQTPAKPRPKTRWTCDEYCQLADSGVFGDRHVELINGETRGRRYSQIEVLNDSATVTPLAMPNRSIRIADLLP